MNWLNGLVSGAGPAGQGRDRRGEEPSAGGRVPVLWHALGVSGTVETVRTSLWRSRGMQALIGVTFLGFASYCLTLASLPVYAVQGGADESTAGVVTAVFLVCTIAVQATIPALTARFGVGPVLVVGLVAMGVPSPLYVLDDGVATWLPAFFMRSLGLTLVETSWFYAGIAFIGGVAGIALGGVLADRVGGARVTIGAFAVMALGAVGAPGADGADGAAGGRAR